MCVVSGAGGVCQHMECCVMHSHKPTTRRVWRMWRFALIVCWGASVLACACGIIACDDFNGWKENMD